MREILFRAKRIDNGEWVDGFYVMFSTSIAHPYSHTNGEHNIITVPHNTRYKVDPETVCQYTGLTDKNGKKIFENDILQGHGNKNELCKVVLGGFYIIDVETLEKVEYVNGWHTEVIPTDALSKTEPFCLDMPLIDFYIERSEFVIVDNIFDNPELLGKENERSEVQ